MLSLTRLPRLPLFGTGLPLRIAITFACQLAFVLFGYDQGVFSGIITNPSFLETFNNPDPGLEGIIVSIYNLGCFSGCILAFMFCEATGRRLAMWIAMCWIIVGFHLTTTYLMRC
jgi:MFS family permease